MDKVFVFSRGPDDEKDPFLINGTDSPPEMTLLAGRVAVPAALHRHHSGAEPGNHAPARRPARSWRPIAKDGATLAARDALQPAALNIFPGETYNFEFQPAASGSFRLVARQPFYKLQTVARIPSGFPMSAIYLALRDIPAEGNP